MSARVDPNRLITRAVVTLLGVAGAILAVRTAAIVQVLLQEHLTREDA